MDRRSTRTLAILHTLRHIVYPTYLAVIVDQELIKTMHLEEVDTWADTEEVDMEEMETEAVDTEEADTEEVDTEEANTEEVATEEVETEEADTEEVDMVGLGAEIVDTQKLVAMHVVIILFYYTAQLQYNPNHPSPHSLSVQDSPTGRWSYGSLGLRDWTRTTWTNRTQTTWKRLKNGSLKMC
ncbi:PREDICTED: uncharacterized protein LOC106818004 [Priapulus caudatus]|uniref:Uncharacterized protein LOC106818004 n=1 Tax=Priapulus caudatus TaxID=37621 RepID=A0ABM1F185_PRICU|nr:PREDICTED: uncharacterized protein LOC106818004 [Priapulus caudatus]